MQVLAPHGSGPQPPQQPPPRESQRVLTVLLGRASLTQEPSKAHHELQRVELSQIFIEETIASGGLAVVHAVGLAKTMYSLV